VIRTRVGYAGGTKKNPTYHDLGDHSETVELDYDPARITYQDLLNVFWKGHSPQYRSWSRQYASIIFYHNEEQRRLAVESKERIASVIRGSVYTDIMPYAGFTLAEEYHQKHSLRQYPEFMQDLRRIYPSNQDFVSSTAAARLNGYLGGEGSYAALAQELDSLGLSPERKESLREMVRGRKGSAACPVSR
jgi:peptide-methionine (S)-S-oxide reductase